jgi:hypothetical protein
MLYFTCESAGTAVTHVTVAVVVVVFELTPLIQVCALDPAQERKLQ